MMKPQRENEVTQNFLGLREGLGAFEDGVGNRNPRLVPCSMLGWGCGWALAGIPVGMSLELAFQPPQRYPR